jgi:hypothetical protein
LRTSPLLLLIALVSFALPASADPSTPESASEPRGIEAIILKPVVHGELEDERETVFALLADTAQDLDLLVDLGQSAQIVDEDQLAKLARERGKLIVLPMMRVLGDDLIELRIVAARPDTKVLATRVAKVSAEDLEVRAVVMLRDVVTTSPGRVAVIEPGMNGAALATEARSRGRSILAVNGTLYGGFVGYSMQRASESDDPRLLYPLIAVGAGIGLGATLIVGDEWDVGVGDAWFLAGAWWPAVAGHLIYAGRFGDQPTNNPDEAWSFGLIGSVIGLTVATTALLPRGMGDGGAVLAHSGGALGLIAGGLTEFAITGDAEVVPFAGTGYGAAIGWLAASGTAMLWHPEPGRVLVIDLGILLGGLAGASAASPLLFDEPNADKTRGWVAAAGGGLLVGAAAAAWLSSPDSPPASDTPVSNQGRSWLHHVGMPQLGMLPIHTTPGEVNVPAVGATLSGQLW